MTGSYYFNMLRVIVIRKDCLTVMQLVFLLCTMPEHNTQLRRASFGFAPTQAKRRLYPGIHNHVIDSFEMVYD